MKLYVLAIVLIALVACGAPKATYEEHEALSNRQGETAIQVDALGKSHDETQQAIKDLGDQISKLNDVLSDAEQSRTDLNKKLEDITIQVKDLSDAQNELDILVSDIQNSIDELSDTNIKSLDTLSKDIDNHKETLDKLDEDISKWNKELGDTQTSVKDVKDQLDSISTETVEPTPEPAPITAQDAYPDIFDTATRVDILSNQDLREKCTSLSTYDSKNGDYISVKVAFALREDNFMRDIEGDSVVALTWLRGGNDSDSDPGESSEGAEVYRYLDNPWNSNGNPYVVAVYKGEVSLRATIGSRIPNVGNNVAGTHKVRLTENTYGISCEKRLNEQESINIGNVVDGSFIVAWYVE